MVEGGIEIELFQLRVQLVEGAVDDDAASSSHPVMKKKDVYKRPSVFTLFCLNKLILLKKYLNYNLLLVKPRHLSGFLMVVRA